MKKRWILLIVLALIGVPFLIGASSQNRIVGDLYVTGAVSAGRFSLPAASIDNADISASAAIVATKLEHQFPLTYAQESGTTPTTEARVIHTVYGATGTIVSFEAGSVTAETDGNSVTVDLLNDGVSVLTAVITLDSTNTAYVPEAGTIGTATLADGNVLEISITDSSSDANGVFGTVIIREDAASS